MPKLHVFAAVLATGLALGGAANAAVIANSPTLPPLGVGFSTGGGGSCFPAAGVCAVPGLLTFTSIASSIFDPSGQDIVANASLTAQITRPAQPPVPVVLTGTVEEEVLGRTFSTETGSWSTHVLSINLSGPVLGNTLTMGLDPSTPSTGEASVDLVVGHEGQFLVDSFFDVFVKLSIDTTIPLTTTRSAHLALVPEPASLALLAGATLGMAVARRRGRAI
jgi:PEP-CTERM motif